MRAVLSLLALVCLTSCAPPLQIAAAPAQPIAPAATASQDNAPKEQLRMLPAEVFLRSYLLLFGATPPIDTQKRARGNDGGQLFDSWSDYLSALGFPDYRNDLPRATQTNALMVAAFERLDVALCDRTLEHDLKANPRPPMSQRSVFAFDIPPTILDETSFAPRFDVLHRTFLGYPASLAPPERTHAFFALYRATAERHSRPGVKSRFTPTEAGWATVCYGLVRHPEYQLY